jgi:putative SOS response-associated peptidase YedK
MAEIREMTAGFSRTVNLGNFESATVKASVTVTLEPDEDLVAAHDEMQRTLRALLEETWRAQFRRKPDEAQT